MYGIDKQRLFRDLNANGITLYEQAEKNAFADNWIRPVDISSKVDERERFSKDLNYHKQYEPIYRTIYGKNYE